MVLGTTRCLWTDTDNLAVLGNPGLMCALPAQSGKLHKRTGTPLYMAPELFMRYYGIESDQVLLCSPSCLSSCCLTGCPAL